MAKERIKYKRKEPKSKEKKIGKASKQKHKQLQNVVQPIDQEVQIQKKSKQQKRLMENLSKKEQFLQKPIFAKFNQTQFNSKLPSPKFDAIDIVLSISAVKSMSKQIKQLPQTIEAIAKLFEMEFNAQQLKLRFSVSSFRDHGKSYVCQTHSFADKQKTLDMLKGLKAWGGGKPGTPTSSHHCFQYVNSFLEWIDNRKNKTLRMLFHITDSQPHGRQFGNVGEEQQRCKCGLLSSKIYSGINSKKVFVRSLISRPNEKTKLMTKIFKQNIKNYDSLQIRSADEIKTSIVNMIKRELI